ncbi:MAG: MerR family transcriptional regulator [Candidatus Eisenbacteria bacterium]|nr:MerR family transcriptional regulator [Candidatus Eisenbacteria bacterium]
MRAQDQQKRHPIRVAATRSGVSAHLIRSWERRYGALRPGRTESGRRLYSDPDIRRLYLIRLLLAAGRRIGEVAQLQDEQLEGLLCEDERALLREDERAPLPHGRGARVPVRTRAAPGATAHHLVLQCFEAVESLDEARLERLLAEGAALLGSAALRRLVLVPLMREAGRRWQSGALRIVHEHLASAVVRSHLGAALHRLRPDAGVARVVVGTPAGQRHEIGALSAAVEAAEAGWDVTYLGPDLPAEEIAAAVRMTKAAGVLLGIVYPQRDQRLCDELRALREMLADRIAVLVGGSGVAGYRDTLREIGALIVDPIEALAEALAGALGATRRP